MATKATASIYIDKSYKKKDGTCAISIRVYDGKNRQCFAIPFSMSEGDFNRMMGERPRRDLKDTLLQLKTIEKKAIDIINKLPVFTFDGFKKLFYANQGATDSVRQAFDNYIEILRNENRIGSAVAYEAAKTSLNKYCVEKKILVQKITDKETGEEKLVSNYTFAYVNVPFLKDYQKWMEKKGKTTTSIGIYLRSLRALFNMAIAEGEITKDLYPFGRRKYEIPAAKNIKKALSLGDVRKIFHHQLEPGSTAERMRDYWVFLYMCNGINVKDFCRLKNKNIHYEKNRQSGFIAFKRAKTEFTKKTTEDITADLTPQMQTIIAKHGTKSINPESYLFPILDPDITPQREYELIQLQVALINDHMKVIAKQLDIDVNLTTYVARHSFATIAKRSGASTELISEMLGHSNTAITKAYLASFEIEAKRKVSQALTAFEETA